MNETGEGDVYKRNERSLRYTYLESKEVRKERQDTERKTGVEKKKTRRVYKRIVLYIRLL
jgi:hypothetical protein